MIDHYLLEQLVALKKYGTLVGAAEQLNITQPALSKAMKKLEFLLGIPLFHRSNRKIVLNETGLFLAERAEEYLMQGELLIQQVYNYHKSLNNLSIGTNAPGPIYDIVPILNSIYPEQSITSKIDTEANLLTGLEQGIYHLISTHHDLNSEELYSYKYKIEHLFLSVPQTHRLAHKKCIYPEDLNGEYVLIYTDIGIWSRWIAVNFPDIHLLMMDDRKSLMEAIDAGMMPCFVSDTSLRLDFQPKNQIYIPLITPYEALSFYLTCKKKDFIKYKEVYQVLMSQRSDS